MRVPDPVVVRSEPVHPRDVVRHEVRRGPRRLPLKVHTHLETQRARVRVLEPALFKERATQVVADDPQVDVAVLHVLPPRLLRHLHHLQFPSHVPVAQTPLELDPPVFE